ncbi:chitinase, partial [Francisella tularensis subsp. holarctica]|nr:chitinase [Francisella tularensis subsp. holarctica]
LASAAFPNINFSPEVANSIGKTGGWSVLGSVDAYIKAGVPANKLIVGLPLYASSMTVASDTDGGLLQTITAPGFGVYEA